MSTVLDIPERDGQDGATQLAYLRSYLKDTEIGNYTYSDNLLIELLVESDRVAVWQDLTGYLGETPWDYTTTAPISYESRIRMLTGDTDEGALRYTDYDLQVFLETIPLRYIVKLINAEGDNSVTYPTNDVNNPIYIVRRYLGDTDTNNVKYRDVDITQMLFNSRLDPFAFVAEELSRSAGETVSGSVAAGGNDLASIDGISFSEGEKRTDSLIKDLSFLQSQAITSVYFKNPVYGFWLDGENLVDTEWEKSWYGI
tara:strand:+ start:76747 stop:77514 length:768 start_codon:yes stop_codon:yes gene_type:complete